MIERRWRRWATRLLTHECRSYVRTIRRRWRRCLTRLLIDEYREYVRAIPWSRHARRLLLDGRCYQLSIMHGIRTKWRTLTAGYLFAARLGEWRWDVRERHAAYRQRTPGAPTSRYWRQQLDETRIAIEEVFRCNWINNVTRSREIASWPPDVVSPPIAEVYATRIAQYRKPSQDDHRPVAAEQSAASLAQLGQHTAVQGQLDKSCSQDDHHPVAAEQSATSLAQLGQHTDVQGQLDMVAAGNARHRR